LAASVASAVVFTLVVPSPVQGCRCLPAEHWGFLGPRNGTLPANAAGVPWFKPFDRHRPQPPPAESDVAALIAVEKRVRDRFEVVPGIARRVDGFPGIFVIAPREGLLVGATYRFTDRGWTRNGQDRRRGDLDEELGSGPYRQVQVTVDADSLSASAQLFLERGALVESPLRIAEGDLCGMSARRQALAPIVSFLSSDARKWRESLLFRTLVDGEPWAGAGSSCSVIPSGRSWRPLGREIVYGACPDPDVRPGAALAFRGPGGRARVLAPTRHTVQMEAHLPGTDIVLKTGTLTVNLTCPDTVTPSSSSPSSPVPVRRRLETRVGLVYTNEVDSLGRTHSFTLATRQTVHVSLTGMSRNFDCSVNGSPCSNRDGTRDDDWSGELEAGFHDIRVSSSDGERGDYTIMAVVHCPPGHFASGGACYRYVPP